MKYDTATPYTAAYVILRQDDKIAFVLRNATGWMNGYYGLPSGKVEVGESFTAAAIREAREEIGVSLRPDQLAPVLTVQRKDKDSQWVDVYFVAATWEGEPYNAEPDMHSEQVWLDADDLPDNVIPAVRSALQHIQMGHHYAEQGW